MITNNEAYFLGLMYAKGDILTDDKNVRFRINIKYRRPDDEALRKDNIYTKLKKKTSGKEKVGSRFYDDVIKLKSMLDKTFDINFDLMLDNATGSSWSKKDISLTSEKVPDNDARFTKLFLTDKITAKTLQTFPFALQIHTSRAASLNFVQGVCDACSLVPNEASSQNGGEGSPRIQLEPSQERWELCIALCEVFQLGLGIMGIMHSALRGFSARFGHQGKQYKLGASSNTKNLARAKPSVQGQIVRNSERSRVV